MLAGKLPTGDMKIYVDGDRRGQWKDVADRPAL